MAQNRFHSLELANNAVAKNFHFESLVDDTSVVSAGRIWINSTDKLFKYSSLDAQGALVINSFASLTALSAAIATLQADVTAAIATAGSSVTAEAAARAAAVDALNQALAAEVAARTAADSAEATARQEGIANEASLRTAAIAVASATAADAVATEATARLAGDAEQTARADAIQAELDATQEAAGLDVDGSYVAPENTSYISTTTSLKGASVALDAALTAEVTDRTTAIASLASVVANEAQSRADGDANLQTQLQAWVNQQITANDAQDAEQLAVETAARIAAVSALQTELDQTQATIGTDADGKLVPITGTHYLNEISTVFGGAFALDAQLFTVSESLVAETLARTTADAGFVTSLQQETTDRTAADATIQAELNQTQTGAGLETTGAYLAATNSNYLNAATSLKDADGKLDAALKAVADRATAIETVSIPELQTQVTTEVARAVAAEAAEASARSAADEATNAALAAEVTARGVAETALDGKITQEATDRASVDAGLQTQIDAVVAASGSGATALKATLNATRFTYKSAAAALEHVITHGMGTEFYSCNVMVKGTDGVWRNDIVPVEDVDTNSFKITLSEACELKASGQSNAQLA